MTEEEVRSILTQYNTDMSNILDNFQHRIDSILMENEKLSTKLKEVEKENRDILFDMQKMKESLQTVEKEKEHYKTLSQQLEEKIKMKDKQLMTDELNKIMISKEVPLEESEHIIQVPCFIAF
jgi:hypothetical protein